MENVMILTHISGTIPLSCLSCHSLESIPHTSYFAKGDQSPKWHIGNILGNSNAPFIPRFFFFFDNNSCPCQDKELSITETNQPTITLLICSWISCCTKLMKGIPIREDWESIGNGKCYDSHLHFGNHSFIMSILSFFTVHTSYFAKGDQSPR